MELVILTIRNCDIHFSELDSFIALCKTNNNTKSIHIKLFIAEINAAACDKLIKEIRSF